jgi:hypothetical protein
MMEMVRRLFVTSTIALLVGLGALTAAGVGAAAAPPQPAKTPKACSLLTTRQVSKVLGMKMHAGKPRSIPSGQGLTSDRCDWESTKKGAGGISGTPLQFNVATFTGKGAREQLDGLLAKDAAAGIEYHAVPELGDDAIYEVPTHTVAVLSADTRLLVVRINPTSLDTSQVDLEAEAVTVAAAKLAVKRLEKR